METNQRLAILVELASFEEEVTVTTNPALRARLREDLDRKKAELLRRVGDASCYNTLRKCIRQHWTLK